MTIRLSPEQENALDLRRSVFLSAGAGSGKTGVLIERYLRALADVDFDLDAVLAVTFTKKATAEVVRRVRDEVTLRALSDPERAPRWRRVREHLANAWILTIDAFCYRVLGTMGPAAGLAARRRILTGGALSEITADALHDVVDAIADDPNDPDRESLRTLLTALGRGGLAKRLSALLERRARSVPWARAMLEDGGASQGRLAAVIAALEGRPPSLAPGDLAEEHARQVALARVFTRLLERFRERLALAGACDFRQLLEDVADRLGDERFRRRWSARFRHVLVDELQDTDPLQWEVFRALFGDGRLERSGLFVVGDDKQAIFSFRDGDVVTFHRGREEIAAAGGSVLTLTENYRSTPRLVEVFNRFSAVLFSNRKHEFEAEDAVMTAARARDPRAVLGIESAIEILIGRGDDARAAREAELHAVATRIRRFVDEGARVLTKAPGGEKRIAAARMEDVAILLQRRTHLADIEAVLGARGIPFRVLGGVGFYEQEEVRALCNLMRFLVDEDDDLALLGTLRSSSFMLPDSVLLAAARSPLAPPGPLWRKVKALAAAARTGAAGLPTPSDAPALDDAVRRLERLRALADRLPADRLLALAVRESDLMLTLGVADPSGRAAANVEKLLDLARRSAGEGVVSLEGLVRTIALAERDSDTPEAQADPPASDAVSILTVHAAKGLEWPIVFVPATDLDFSSGGERAALPPALVRQQAAMPLLYEVGASKDGPLRECLDALESRERTAEQKRLLYVAATRARDHLVFSAAVKSGKPHVEKKDSWLKWVLAAKDPGIPILDPAPSPVHAPRAAAPIFERPWDPGSEPAAAAVPGQHAPLAIPATALFVLRSCPRRFLIEHVIGVPARPAGAPSGAAGEKASPARARGSAIHAALEGIASGVDPVSRAAGAAARFGLFEPEEVAEIEAHVRSAVARLRAWPLGRAILEARPGEVASEVPFDLGTDRCRVVGSLDLLHVPAGGPAAIVDFKTDRVRGDPLAFAAAHGYVDQLQAYAAAVRDRENAAVTAWLFFTESGAAVPVVGPGGVCSSDEASEAVARTIEEAPGLAAAGFPLTPRAETCETCPHWRQSCAGGARA